MARRNDDGHRGNGGRSSDELVNLDSSSVAREERIAALRRALKRSRSEQRQGLDRTTTVALLVQWLHDESAA